jgi:hypothetical protein
VIGFGGMIRKNGNYFCERIMRQKWGCAHVAHAIRGIRFEQDRVRLSLKMAQNLLWRRDLEPKGAPAVPPSSRVFDREAKDI